MLRRVLLHTSTTETQQVSMNVNFALDCASPEKLVINISGPSEETQEQLERSLKQAITARKEVEALQDVSFLFQKRHCELRTSEEWIPSSGE